MSYTLSLVVTVPRSALSPVERERHSISPRVVYDTFTGGYGHDEHTGEPEPQDRIDFVYAAGDWRVTDSDALVAGDPTPIPDHGDNEWTSDHSAVMTTFKLPQPATTRCRSKRHN